MYGLKELASNVKKHKNCKKIGLIPKLRHGLRVREGQTFCDDTDKFLVLKRVTIAMGGIQNFPQLCDVIYTSNFVNFVKVCNKNSYSLFQFS